MTLSKDHLTRAMIKSMRIVLVIFLIVYTMLTSTYEYRHNILKRNTSKKLNDHDTDFPCRDQIAGLKERGVKELSGNQSVLSNNQQQINKHFKRVRKDIDTEMQNATTHISKCEIPSLSCHHCCNNSDYCLRETRLCRCDPLCTFYNDCCGDYELFCGKRRHIPVVIGKERFLCVKPKNVDLKSRFKTLWMVKKCPNSRSIEEISRECDVADQLMFNLTNIPKLIPVISQNGIVFRNKFCAQCNGVKDFEYFGVKIKCFVVPPSSISSFHELAGFASKYCDLNFLSIFRKINQTIRECSHNVCLSMKELNRTCSQLSLLSEKDCISKVYSCNSNLTQLEFDNDCPGAEVSEFPRSSIPPSFTVALRVSQDKAPLMQVLQCPLSAQFYDPYLQTCRPGQTIKPPIEQNLDKFTVVVWFEAIGLQRYPLPSVNETVHALAHLFHLKLSRVSALQEIQNDSHKNHAYRIISFEIKLTNEQSLSLRQRNHTADSMSNLKNDLRTSSNVLPLHRLLFFSGKFNVSVSNQTFAVFKTTSRQLACIRKKIYPKGSYISYQNGEYYYINSTGKTFFRNQVFFEEKDGNKSISICEQIVFATCMGRRINLTSDEYVKFDNLSIFYNRTKTIYDFGEYGIHNGHIFMCIPGNLRSIIHWTPNDSMTGETYLTLICLSLSLACLFLVILTYVIFRELRTLPGKNLLSLSMSLFLVQVLWLIPDHWYHSTLCQIMAVVEHYLFLVSFVAMTIIAWDTYCAFGSKVVRRDSSTKNHQKRKFYINSAMVWGLPAMFVAVCTAVDQKNIYAVYVNELWCWFDNVQVQKYLFVLPVGVLLLCNVILFALTVFRIQRMRFTTRMVCHRKMFWVYLKLSALMGFCWLFGFIYLLVEAPVFSYLFVIFASLQGVYIAFAFLVKKKIWVMYKKLLQFKQNRYKPDYRCTLIQDLNQSKETRL